MDVRVEATRLANSQGTTEGDAAQAFAMVYVGDQLARLADALESVRGTANTRHGEYTFLRTGSPS